MPRRARRSSGRSSSIRAKPRYYFNLADAKKFTEGDAHLAAMEERLRNPDGLSTTARSRLDFALAKAYDDLGRYDDAFDCMREGNALKRGQIDYDEAGTLGHFDRIRAIFDRRLLESERTEATARRCRCSWSACRARARRWWSRSWRAIRRFTAPASCLTSISWSGRCTVPAATPSAIRRTHRR